MTENILVVEYEPRYTERVRQALAGQPITPTFAKDGEEAIRALDSQPKLIVLSSVVPKISANDIIRAVRDRKALERTPILLTVSGYTGHAPQQDAARMGASDILPKPYSESDFLSKVREMLAAGGAGATQQLTSKDIFGDLLGDDNVVKPKASVTGNVDALLQETLAGMMPRRKDTASRTATPTAPGTTPVPRTKTAPGSTGTDFNKKLHDTLSGLEKSSRKVTSPGTAAVPPAPEPAPPPPAATPRPAAPPPVAAKPAPAAPQRPVTSPPAAAPVAAKPAPPPHPAAPKRTPPPDKIPLSQPVIVAAPPAAAPALALKEDEEPTDGIRFGQYVLLDKIATGGMAEVWKARMRGVEGFQKIVAIKKILPHLSDNQDFIEMFVDEAKLAAQLNHNNIIHIYDLGKIGNSYYIAMEYVDGHDLKTILRRGTERDQPMNVELALFIASKIASALDYAHRKRDFDEKEMGLVHRDVSPQNVLISQEGDIKLCDFGIAKAASKASHTQAGALKGKLQYMSPEQAWGKNIDRRSDIFALGTVLFELLTNRKLFTGENEMSILEQVREARVVPPSQFNEEVTPEIDRIVFKALQKDPENRYQTAGEMARDIDSVLYTFRPTPTSADLAIFMHRIWVEQAPILPHRVEEEPPVMDSAPDLARTAPKHVVAAAPPVAASAPAPAPAALPMPAWESATAGAAPPEKKRSAALPVAAAVVVVAVAVGGYFVFGRRGPQPVPATTKTAATPTAAASGPLVPTTTATATTATGATTSAVPATGTAAQAPALDSGAVAQEVQKRLAAERTKLEQQTRAQETATTAPARTATTATQPPPQTATQQATATVAPPPPQPAPVTETHAPVAAPVVDTAPAAPEVREGDLVPSGTPGLVLPRIARRATVPYPPMARAQRVEGTVIMSILVSETGQVLDTRVIKGTARSVGLNEAAQEMMRRSTFTPATKDGVKVKTWTTERVDFKL